MKFTDVGMIGRKFVPPTIQTSVKFHEFQELYLLIFEQNNFKLCYFTNLKVLFPAEFTEFLVHLSMSKVEQKKAWKDQFVQSEYFSVEG